MANAFSLDPNCKALWNWETGSLLLDSIGNNDWTNFPGSNPVETDTINFKQGVSSGFFDKQNTSGSYNPARPLILDPDLDSGFPLKNGESNKTFSFGFWARLDPLEPQINNDNYCFHKSLSSRRSVSVGFVTTAGVSKAKAQLSSDGVSFDFSVTHDSVVSVGVWYHVVFYL